MTLFETLMYLMVLGIWSISVVMHILTWRQNRRIIAADKRRGPFVRYQPPPPPTHVNCMCEQHERSDNDDGGQTNNHADRAS